jgi:penicillin-binding protein 1A
VRDADGEIVLSNRRTLRRTPVIPETVASQVTQILQTVVTYGTGKAAAIPGFAAGKTGTTENYGDAWFVGWNEQMTVAVWVGYPDRLVPMLTEYGGEPVAGGTYPAVLWHDFMTQAIAIFDQRAAMAEALRDGEDPASVDLPSTGVETAPPGDGTTTTDDDADGGADTTAPSLGDTGGDDGTGDGGGTVTPPAGGDTGTPTPPAGGDDGTGTPTPPASGGGGAAAPSG